VVDRFFGPPQFQQHCAEIVAGLWIIPARATLALALLIGGTGVFFLRRRRKRGLAPL